MFVKDNKEFLENKNYICNFNNIFILKENHNKIKKNRIKTSQIKDPEIIKTFYCPITYEIMIDPVITSDGFTYERSAIHRWFRDHDTNPMTNTVLFNKMLIPNRILKSMIERFKKLIK